MVLSKKQKEMLSWRRDRVLELVSKGHGVTDIANILKVHKSMISKDIAYINLQAKQNLQEYIDKKLPGEYQNCLIGITSILKESFDMAQEPDIERKEKLQALSLAKECYITKLDLLTNSTILNDAMKFVAKHQNQQSNQLINGNGKGMKIDSEKAISTEEEEDNSDSNSDNGNGNGHDDLREEDQTVDISSSKQEQEEDTSQMF